MQNCQRILFTEGEKVAEDQGHENRGMKLNFIFSDALAPGGSLHIHGANAFVCGVVATCLFFPLFPSLSPQLSLLLTLIFSTSVTAKAEIGFVRLESAAYVVSVAFDLRCRLFMGAYAHYFSFLHCFRDFSILKSLRHSQ